MDGWVGDDGDDEDDGDDDDDDDDVDEEDDGDHDDDDGEETIALTMLFFFDWGLDHYHEAVVAISIHIGRKPVIVAGSLFYYARTSWQGSKARRRPAILFFLFVGWWLLE